MNNMNTPRYKENLSNDLFTDRKGFSEYISKLIYSKNLRSDKVWRNSNIDRKLFSKYLSGNNIPSKINARKLLFGLKCSVSEANILLKYCGYQFTDNTIDQDIIKALENKQYTLLDFKIY